MKTLILSSLAIAGLAMVGWQHQQLGQLRAEKETLQKSATEADQLKSDLAKFDSAHAQDAAAEIDRLREENHDLLKLRNEVNQLRNTRAEFQKVSAENQRLHSQPRATPQPIVNQILVQPIVINMKALYDRGLNTPEATIQTFFWAERENNVEAACRCVLPESQAQIRDAFSRRMDFKEVESITIVARRELNANTVQLGLETQSMDGAKLSKIMYTLSLQNGEWKLDPIILR